SFNSIDTIIAGNGGNGAANTSVGPGGRGGRGGSGAGIVVAAAPEVSIYGNDIKTLTGGGGGAGGGGAAERGGGGGGGAGGAAETRLGFPWFLSSVRPRSTRIRSTA